MDTFVIFENIRRFKALLAQQLEPTQRGTVEHLLAEEEATLAAAAAEQAPCRPDGPGAEARPDQGVRAPASVRKTQRRPGSRSEDLRRAPGPGADGPG